MKILYGYPYFPSRGYDNNENIVFAYLNRLREAGIDIEPFCVTVNPPNARLTFPEIEKRWKYGEKSLFQMYDRLQEALVGKDVFINSAGINLHPYFVESLDAFTVFGCNDDPESSADLSKPVANAYDLCLVGNIAEVDTYRSWGVKHAAWRPLGLMPEIYNHDLTEDMILDGQRDIDLFMMIDKNFPVRKPRMEVLDAAFPGAEFYGPGWSKGILPPSKQVEYLNRAKIGPNVHNSTGPINFRTFYLPANGVMQICDNKSHLGQIYELNKEVVGFDSISECIDLCRYYLAHDEERRKIAAAGWKRAIQDYNEISVFKRDMSLISKLLNEKKKMSSTVCLFERQKAQTKHLHWIYTADSNARKIMSLPSRIIRKIKNGSRRNN